MNPAASRHAHKHQHTETSPMIAAPLTSPSGRGRTSLVTVLSLLATAVICATFAAAAHAAPSLNLSTFTAGAYNQDGSDATQAGAAPWELRTTFAFDTFTGPNGNTIPGGNVKSTVVDLPAGAVGNPGSMPQCLPEQIEHTGGPTCPVDSQIGQADIDTTLFGRQLQNVPIFNMKPPPGQPAQFAFLVIATVAHIDVNVRTGGDYGVRATVNNINAISQVYGVTIHIWGVPADATHDPQRWLPGATGPGDGNGGFLHSGMNRTPFLRTPTSCTGPVSTQLAATSWQEPDRIIQASAPAPAVTGCSRVPFRPSASVTPASRSAAAPAGMNFDIDVPQNNNPDGIASSDVKRVVMKLPAGVGINPSASDGLQGCRDSDFAIASATGAQCPNASKIGSVKITSPLLQDPIEGSVFLASPLEQGPVAAANGRMFRLFLEGQGAGVTIKLAGSVVPNPVTGQLTATFDGNPQLPFSNLHLELVGGSRAPLSTPKVCGTYVTTAELTPWSAPTTAVTSESRFTIDQNCDQADKFEPTLDAGLTNPVAGGSSPFTLTISRPSGQQDIVGTTVSLPPGLLGHVGSVPLCPDAQAAAGTCSSASQIGRTIVASGTGDQPVYLPQAGKTPTAVYLAGPYNGAPYSLSIVVPAQAGPYDLGVVVVRAALSIDPVDAHVTVVSDPIPTMLLGVPLDIQKINVTIDRPGFMANPTNCSRMGISSQVSSAGKAVELTSPFQVGGCASLKVEPKFKFALSGKGQTTDGKHPAFTADLTLPSGGANLKKVTATLPLSLALDPDNSQSDNLCEFTSGSKTIPECPEASIVGTATAITPLLNVPLTGPIYFVKNVRLNSSGRQIRTLPTLAIPLRGGGITLVLRATSAVVANHLVTTFDKIPDAAVSSFRLALNGGKKAILVVSGADVCKGTQVAQHVTTGQNGKVVKGNITLSTPCTLGVVASSRTASRLSVRVGGIGAGKVTVSGSGLTNASRTIADVTTATISLKLSTSMRARIARGHDVKVKISFTPQGAKKAKVAYSVIKLKGKKK
jgi:hypothetical protein